VESCVEEIEAGIVGWSVGGSTEFGVEEVEFNVANWNVDGSSKLSQRSSLPPTVRVSSTDISTLSSGSKVAVKSIGTGRAILSLRPTGAAEAAAERAIAVAG